MRIVGTICGQNRLSAIDIEDGSIAAIGPVPRRWEEAGEVALGGPDCSVCPAMLDIQVNGFHGHDLNADSTRPEDVAAVAESLRQAGVALFCPTVVTGSFTRMSSSLRAIAAACEHEGLAPAIPCVHMEGPYISSEDGPRGAHPLEHVRDPHWGEFLRLQDAAGGRIGIVTLAPERRGAIQFIERLADAGIVAAIGHTAAAPGQIEAAAKAGARLSTHLGNGAHALIPRHPNYIWEQLAADELAASIIADGHHLPPSVVKCVIRCKGIERTILASDAVHFAGLPPGEYQQADRVVEVTAQGRVQLKGTPYLAGSALALCDGVRNVVRFAAVTLAEAVQMTTLNPARLLGMQDRLGTIEAGKEASLLLYRWDQARQEIEVRHTLLRGQVVYSAP